MANGRVSRHAVLGLLLALACSPGVRAQIREVPPLPATITDPRERLVLQTEIDRMHVRRDALLAVRQKFARECNSGVRNGHRQRDCLQRYAELRRETAEFDGALDDFERRMASLAGRSSGGPVAHHGRRPAAVRPDRRIAYLVEAMDVARFDWRHALARLQSQAAARSGDPAMRDVAAYLDGMYRGHLNADSLTDPYYRHGVRRWLANDYWSAALAFAKTALDRPNDLRVFRSYAFAVGRQNAAPACIRARRCVSGDMAAFGALFGPDHQKPVAALVGIATRQETPAAAAGAINVLRGLAVYAVRASAGVTLPDAARRRAAAALAASRAGNWAEAASGYVAAWAAFAPDRALVYMRAYRAGYGGGSGAPAGLATGLPTGPPTDDDTLRDALERARAPADADGGPYPRESFVALRRALSAEPDSNPFRGSLTRDQIVRMQR